MDHFHHSYGKSPKKPNNGKYCDQWEFVFTQLASNIKVVARNLLMRPVWTGPDASCVNGPWCVLCERGLRTHLVVGRTELDHDVFPQHSVCIIVITCKKNSLSLNRHNNRNYPRKDASCLPKSRVFSSFVSFFFFLFFFFDFQPKCVLILCRVLCASFLGALCYLSRSMVKQLLVMVRCPWGRSTERCYRAVEPSCVYVCPSVLHFPLGGGFTMAGERFTVGCGGCAFWIGGWAFQKVS